MSKHAKLSPSSSHRWIACHGSHKLEQNYPNVMSEYASEGIEVHNIASQMLDSWYNKDIVPRYNATEYLSDYVDYVRSIGIKGVDEVYIEKTVKFDHVIPDGFGTADCIVIKENELHIIDLKWGAGIKVDSYKNTQLILYAIGAINELCQGREITDIFLHIFQPRIGNISKYSIKLSDLTYWENIIKEAAIKALSDNAELVPSKDACRFCRAKNDCPALTNMAKKAIEISKKKDGLCMSDKKYILDNKDVLTNFLNSIEKEVYDTLLAGGDFQGYKLVSSVGRRQFRDDAERTLESILGEMAYEKKLIGITKAEKLLDKNVVSTLTEAKTTIIMVKESDNRTNIKQLFD